MSGILAAVAWFGAVALSGLAGPMVPGVRQLLALAALLVLGTLGLAQRQDRGVWLRLLGFALLLTATAFLPSTLARGIAYSGAVAAAAPVSLAGLAPGLFFAFLATALWSWVPGAATVAAWLATLLGNLVVPAEDDLALGPSALALPAFAWAAVLLIARARHTRHRWPLAAIGLMFAALIAAPFLAELWITQLGPHAGHDHPRGPFENYPISLAFLAVFFLVGWYVPEGADAQSEQAEASWPRATGFVAAGLLLGGLGAVLLSGWRGEGPPDRRLAILNVGVEGSMDWDRPTFDKLGAFSGGMFGLLPLHLQRCGWEVSPMEESELATLDTSRTRVVVILNCPRKWSEVERGQMEAFVEAGGSLVVLGDHTDVFGLMDGLNSLLGPWGIRFRFDSAYHTGGGWADDMEWIPGLFGYSQDPRDAGVGIGASLEVRSPARPVIAARYAFSDWGVRENLMGSFLGNYQYEPGERLGDLALVAGLRRGRGRVIAYGDTSGLQNAALASYFASHVEPLLSELSRPAAFALPRFLEIGLALLLLIAAGGCCLAPSRHWRVFAPALGLPLLAGAFLVPEFSEREVITRTDLSEFLLMDDSHHPDIGHYEAGWNPVGPLMTTAQRSGLLVARMQSWDAAAVGRARAIALIGPELPLEPDEVDALVAAMEQGATVLVAASAGERGGVAPLLQRFGIEIEPISLGSVPPPGQQEETEPRFVGPSPLLLPAGGEVRELYRFGNEVLAAALPVGKGWLVVFGDTRFFSMGNVEGMWGWWGGNLRFLHDLFQEFFGGQPSELRPVFEPPSPPEGL